MFCHPPGTRPGWLFSRSPGPVTVDSDMGRIFGVIAAAGTAALLAAGIQAAPASASAAAAGVGPMVAVPPAGAGPAQPGTPARPAASFRRIILPDLLIVAPKGLTSRQAARLRKLAGVRSMITFDGAEITAGGRPASVIGVSPAQFRSWVPLRTASDQAFWTALSRGAFVASASAARRLALRPGASYQLTAGTSRALKFGAAAQLGLAGVDLLVNSATSRELGLVHQVAGLISAPGAALTTLISQVKAVLGPAGKIVSLRTEQLPQQPVRPGQLPGTYLQLFRASAARYCPGLSWTVLAAIGQIESADGTNMGPSSAGALGPMQFMPATWAQWGIDGFGLTGAPDVMNPYDAVPAAARLLCADGAAAGGRSLQRAVFDYNHANWYVNEVLALAAKYAADYR
jgi:hypothetical protein